MPGMTESPSRYDVALTVDRGGGHLLNPGRVRRGSRADSIRSDCQRHEHV